MIGKRVISEKPVSLPEVFEILEREKKGELDYSQRLAYDHTQKFAGIDAERARKLKEELLKLEKLNEQQAVVIIDLLPQTKQDVELLFQKTRLKLEDSDIDKILEVVRAYRE
jgi:DNA-directed RNA polymerase subunit F